MTDDDTKDITNTPADDGIDLTGVGKDMRAIPPPAWQRMVDKACTTIEKALAPMTETAHEIAQHIKAKFDNLKDIQQVMVAGAVASAKKKASQSSGDIKMPRLQILMQVIENSANEVDGGVRELWSNLLAQEMLTQGVHPEITRVLSRISSEDAQLLVKITEQKQNTMSKLFADAVRLALKSMPYMVVTLNPETTTFNHTHLRNLGLIKKYGGKWDITVFGKDFIRAVTDPSLEQSPTNET